MDGWEESALTLEVNGKSYTRPELLAYWISERERIRLAKRRGEDKPWSDDPVFQNTYFCNIHREDDKVTRWIRENYTPDIFGEYYEVAIVAARIFNRPETLEAIKFHLVPSPHMNLWKVLTDMQEAKEQIWSGAYLITTHGRKMSKIDYCVELLQNCIDITPVHMGEPTCEGYFHAFKRVDGLGSFLSAQIVADLKNTKGHPLQAATDWYTFSAPGPGSLRGLSWFHNRHITNSMYEDAIKEVGNILDWQHPMCMQDLQNCMCEFDKYCRVLTGTGRSKRKYAGS
jgi:hypothetical protein